MTENWKDRGDKAAVAIKRASEATANSVHEVTNFVARNDGRVADGAQAVTHLVGQSLDKAGQGISATGQQASKALHGNASRAADAVRDAINGSGQAGAGRRAAGGLAVHESLRFQRAVFINKKSIFVQNATGARLAAIERVAQFGPLHLRR